MKNHILLILSVLVLALAACQPAATPTQPPVAPTALPTSTELPEPTATQIVIPTATAMPTIVPTDIPTIEPTPEGVAFEDLPALVMAAGQPETIFSTVSPDGAWQADIIRYDCVMVDPAAGDENAYEMLVVTRLEDGTETLAAEQLQYCGGLGSYGFNHFFWSPNSRYYYFDGSREYGSPDGMVCGLLNTGFSRFDVETGALEPVPGSGHSYNDTGILAGWDGTDMVVIDINGGETGRYPFPMENATLQSYQLSPSGEHLAYILSAGCAWEPGNTMAVLVKLTDGSQTVIAESSEPGFLTVAWDESNTIVLVDSDGGSWTYNVSTGSLTGP